MIYYDHYSFDLWLTIIKSNPLFKQERTKYFYQNFNFKHKTLDEVAYIFRQVDLMCNAINEKTGGNINAEEMYLMVISLINDYSTSFAAINLEEIYADMEQLVFRYMPVVYCPETTKVLKHLKETGTSTLSILSNTGFIKGTTLRKVLKQIDLDYIFDFQIYSDETGMSKPNKNLFNLMLNKIAEIKKVEKNTLKQVIHIGDNPNADMEGANAVGINSLLINSNQVSILNLLP